MPSLLRIWPYPTPYLALPQPTPTTILCFSWIDKKQSKPSKLKYYSKPSCACEYCWFYRIAKKETGEANVRDIYFDEEGFLLKSLNRIISQIKEVHETITINGKEYIDMSSDNTPEILIPELPEAN